MKLKIAFLLMFPCLVGAQVSNPTGPLQGGSVVSASGPGGTNPTTAIEPGAYIGQDPSTLGTFAQGWYGDWLASQNMSANTYTVNAQSPGVYSLYRFIGQWNDPVGANQFQFATVDSFMEYNPTAASTALVAAGSFVTTIEGTGNVDTCGQGGFGCGVDGVYSSLAHNGSGTVTLAINFDAAGILKTSSGLITNAVGLFVASMQGVNNYGVLIQDQTAGTTNYAIKTGLGKVSFGDQVAVSKGGAVTSATSITPTGQIFHVTGTTAVATIVAPAGCSDANRGCQLTLIPDAAFTTTAAGNIALASTAVLNKALIMTYDSGTSKWYPSY